jgi:glycosyltransferase involved in cell wall biosynthesis
MRILMINHEFTITGASTTFFRLALHLRRGGHEIVILPIISADGPMADHYRREKVPIATEGHFGEFSLAIGNTICAAPLVCRIACALPTIWFVHEGEVALALLKRNPDWALAFELATAVVYQTPFQHGALRSFTYALDPSKFHVIPLGVDVDPAKLARSRVLPKTTARVVQVGTIEPRKRAEDVIRAVAQLPEETECVICGKFLALDEDAAAIARADPSRFRILDQLPNEEVLAWVESANIFVLASSSETQEPAAY